MAWENGSDPKPITLKSGKNSGSKVGVFGGATSKRRKTKLASTMDKAAFLEQLGKDDAVFTELGGQNDRFCIAAFRRGAKLLRLPSGVICDEQKRQRKNEGKKGEEVETAVSILYRIARANPELFYPFREVDDMRYLEVRLLSRSYWTVQRKIRIATANRLRHLQQDLELIGGIKGLPVIQTAIDTVLETLPSQEEVEVDLDPKEGVAVKFYKSLERKLSLALEAKLEELPLYHAVFKPIDGCGPGITGYIISQVLDIRRFPTLGKLRAFSGYHLQKINSHWEAPKRRKGFPANWDQVLQQAVYYFTSVTDKQKPEKNIWKQKLQDRYRYEIGKLLKVQREEGKDIPDDMTTERFLAMVGELRAEAEEKETIAKLPEPYKGIPVHARKRAMRWLGQQLLKYIWVEWRRFEGIADEQAEHSPI